MARGNLSLETGNESPRTPDRVLSGRIERNRPASTNLETSTQNPNGTGYSKVDLLLRGMTHGVRLGRSFYFRRKVARPHVQDIPNKCKFLNEKYQGCVYVMDEESSFVMDPREYAARANNRHHQSREFNLYLRKRVVNVWAAASENGISVSSP